MPVPTEDVPCSLSNYSFNTQIIDKNFLFQVLQLSGQVYIWIGEADGRLDNLSVGIPGLSGNSSAAATCIFGGGEQSRDLSEKLSHRLKKQVWVSFSTADDLLTTPAILSALMQQIKDHPEKF